MKTIKTLLLCLVLASGSLQIKGQILLGVGESNPGITGLPDTVSFGDNANLSYWVKNDGLLGLAPILMTTYMQINNGTPFVVNTFNLLNILNPGDSIQVTIPNFIFNQPTQQGGGTNVIVIWPTAPGTQPKDSLRDSTYIRDTTTSRSSFSGYPEAKIWPNPAIDRINFPQYPPAWGIEGVEIINLKGEIIRKASREEISNRQVRFSRQPAGLYFVRFLFQHHPTVIRKVLLT